MIAKMKAWMFQCTGEWNVFAFTDEQTIEAYKATVETYEKSDVKRYISAPPFVLDSI